MRRLRAVAKFKKDREMRENIYAALTNFYNSLCTKKTEFI